MSRGSLLLASAVLALIVTGCPPGGDNGRECMLRKSGADGGIPITESEVTPGKDFVSFGAAECENLICVRSSSAPKSGDPTATAYGKCSSRCASPEAKCDSAESSVKLECRALILDEVTLGQICVNDPQKCERFFGGAQTPYFCAQPATVDAGI